LPIFQAMFKQDSDVFKGWYRLVPMYN